MEHAGLEIEEEQLSVSRNAPADPNARTHGRKFGFDDRWSRTVEESARMLHVYSEP